MTLTAARLRQVIEYDPETGRFVWLVKTSNRTPAGHDMRLVTSARTAAIASSASTALFYDTPALAHLAYRNAADEQHGAFART